MTENVLTDPLADASASALDDANRQTGDAPPPAPAPEKTLIPAPRDLTAGNAPRLMPDVSTGEIMGAGASAEAIETDYWFLDQREKNTRMRAAMDRARELGVQLPQAADPNLDPLTAMASQDDPYSGMWSAETMGALLEARKKFPQEFADLPITQEEIGAAVSAELRAEWDDAQATLGAAPGGFFNTMVPEFLGRMGTAATDEINAPLAIATMGVSTQMQLGRLMLMESGLAVAGEAATIPKMYDVSERLGTPEPNPAMQIAFAAALGAGIPVAVRGVQHGWGRGISIVQNASTRNVIDRLRKDAASLTPEDRAGLNAMVRGQHELDTTIAANPADGLRETDAAADQIDNFEPPAGGALDVDPDRIAALQTPPRAQPGANVQMDFELGPGRPFQPDQPILDLVSAAVEDVFGPGSRVVITSGQEGDLPQVGSNRHSTGNAADFRVYDADGKQVTMETNPEGMRELARAASRRGAKGIGLGSEYMGGAHLHVDLVDPDPAQGQASTWGSEGAAMREELDRLRGTGASPRTVEQSVGDLIRDSEARGSYDTASDFTLVAPPKRLTAMTLDELDAWQTANWNAGAESTAAGGYQILRDTLRDLRGELGLDGSELFDIKMQDRLARALMERRGLDDFLSGKITPEEFADNMAQEWAAFPMADGRSAYAGDGLNAATISREQFMSVLTGRPYVSTGPRAPTMTRVAARGVQVDPRTYQFRSEVDESGVGTPMNRVSAWDELLAGDFIIHERLDGSRFIADGHHRHQLAARLEAEGHPPIEFNAFVLREDDGYSVEQVRAIAAVKNIEAGNATAVDAAKVLRVDPAMLERLTLRSSQARDARGLMQLSDEAFDMVTNGLVREDMAAYVPSLSRDPDMQEALLRVLIRMKPRNMAEARQIANDAHRAGLARKSDEQQDSLFGDDFDPAETLFKERAEVMARMLTQLRNDRRVFATLVRESARIKEAGNALTDESNTARLGTDETALALVERLVNRAGPFDDALNAAAGAVRSGGSVRDAVDGLLGVVRGALEGGGIGRLLDGQDGRAGDAATPDARAIESAEGGSARVSDEPAEDLGPGLFDAPEADAPGAVAAAAVEYPGRGDAIFRGEGGAAPAELMHQGIPIAGSGRYWAFTRDDAARYGPNITEARADLDNPLVIQGDEEWRALTQEAGWEFPNPFGTDAAELSGMVEALKAAVLARGHDGIVVRFDPETIYDIDPATGQTIKNLRNIFDRPQLIDYRDAPEAPARASETTTAGDQLLIDGVAPVTARDRLQAAQDAPMRGGQAAPDMGLFDSGARAQPDMFARAAPRADMFADASPMGRDQVAQADAGERALREALARGEDFSAPTGRVIDGQAEMLNLREALAEIDGDTEFLDVLNICARSRGNRA